MKVGGNLFANVPAEMPEELVQTLAGGTSEGVRVERIVSRSHCTPADIWYDQKTDEWVALLSGSAVLRFENGDDVIRLKVGDWITIPAHCRHRVEQTDPSVDTVWLAVHWQSDV